MAKKEMTVKEYERMTKTPYQNKFNKVDYGPEALSKLWPNEFAYTGEGVSNKAGAGRGFVNPQRTDEPDESYVSPKAPAPKKAAPPKDTVFREGMPVPQDIDGGSVRKKKMASGGVTRADGIAQRGKTRGKMC